LAGYGIKYRPPPAPPGDLIKKKAVPQETALIFLGRAD